LAQPSDAERAGVADVPDEAEQVSGWEALPAEVVRLPEELARVDALLDDPVFFERSRPSSIRGSVGRRRRWRPICG
jgi:hypothetical protein